MPLIGVTLGSIIALSSVGSLIYVASKDPSPSAGPNMKIEDYTSSLVVHALLTIDLLQNVIKKINLMKKRGNGYKIGGIAKE